MSPKRGDREEICYMGIQTLPQSLETVVGFWQLEFRKEGCHNLHVVLDSTPMGVNVLYLVVNINFVSYLVVHINLVGLMEHFA